VFRLEFEISPSKLEAELISVVDDQAESAKCKNERDDGYGGRWSSSFRTPPLPWASLQLLALGVLIFVLRVSTSVDFAHALRVARGGEGENWRFARSRIAIAIQPSDESPSCQRSPTFTTLTMRPPRPAT